MATVLVTGASGFIAKHIVRELLERGHAVRAAVRSTTARHQVRALFPDADLDFVTLDLLADDGWAQALDGADVLMHTASPFPMAAPKDPQELIRPAVDGTLRALRAALAGGAHRVVLTSSCAAIYKDPAKAPDAVSTRDNWTDPDGPRTTAYEASKALAERAAWDFVAEHPELRLTVINPGGVLGPPMDEHHGTSLEYIALLLRGKAPGYPRVNLPVVDVRDVARMHALAVENDATVGQRFPANAGALSPADLARTVRQAHPDRRIATRELPDALVRLVAHVVPMLRIVVTDLGHNLDVDGSDAPRVMGFDYIPARDAVRASAAYLVGRAAPGHG